MTSERLPAIIRPDALVALDDTDVVAALIADASDPGRLAISRFLYRQHTQSEHAAGLCARMLYSNFSPGARSAVSPR
jgi:hypothetical protein